MRITYYIWIYSEGYKWKYRKNSCWSKVAANQQSQVVSRQFYPHTNERIFRSCLRMFILLTGFKRNIESESSRIKGDRSFSETFLCLPKSQKCFFQIKSTRIRTRSSKIKITLMRIERIRCEIECAIDFYFQRLLILKVVRVQKPKIIFVLWSIFPCSCYWFCILYLQSWKV